MTYIERNKRSLIKNIYLWMIVFIVLIIVALNSFFPSFVPNLINSVASPFWRLEFSIKNGSLSSQEQLLIENARLIREIESMKVDLETSAYFERENSELRQMFNASSSTKFLVAPIIKRAPFVAYDELIIDAGFDRGVSTSSIAYAVGDIPIGKVIEVYSETSKVLLFSSPNERHEVQVGPKYASATAVGLGGGQYEVELPRGLNIALGDFVIALDLGQKPLGKIMHIDSDPSLTFEKIIFSMPVNMYEMKWVKISLDKI